MEITLRDITEDDLSEVLRLINEFADFEGVSQQVEVTYEKLFSALFAERSFLHSIVATANGSIIGYSFFYPNFFSFRGDRGFHIDDIYVTAAYRGYGVGRRILSAVAVKAGELGYDRVDLLVQKWNESAIDFYQSLGGELNRNERHVRFVDEAYRALIESGT